MKEILQITIKYTGKDVDDGTMSIEDFVPVLQGFASAYGKVVSVKGLTSEHKLRIIGVEKGSLDIVLEVWEWIGENAPQLQTISTLVGSGAIGVVSIILGVLRIKKHIGNKPYTENISKDDSPQIIVTNSKNVKIEFSIEVFKIFKEELLANDFAKIVKPLEKDKIESAQIIVKNKKQKIEETITLEEKPYFDVGTISITETKEAWLTGSFNSLTKSTNKGFFILNDGTRVSYQFATKTPEQFYPFFIYRGPVRVKCIAQVDENLKVTFLDILEIQKLQIELFKEKE